MFCVLRVEKRRSKFRDALRLFRGDEYELKTIPVLRSAPFYELTVRVGKRGVDWQRVCSIAGKCAGKLVLTSEIELPPVKAVARFEGNLLFDKMVRNTFLHILRCDYLKNSGITVCVYDQKGSYTDFVKELSPFVRELVIVTKNKKAYGELCDEIIGSVGVCPIVCDSCPGAQVRIFPEKALMESDNVRIKLDKSQDFTPPDEYAYLLPDGAYSYDFFSALYELCGAFALGDMIFDTVNVNMEKKPVTMVCFS